MVHNLCIVGIYYLGITRNSPLFRHDALNPKRNNGDDDQSNRVDVRRESAVEIVLAATVGVSRVVGHCRDECSRR